MGEENSGFKVEGEEGPIFLLPFHRDCCFLVLLRLGPVYDMCSEMFNRVAEAVVVGFLLALRIRISIVVDGNTFLRGSASSRASVMRTRAFRNSHERLCSKTLGVSSGCAVCEYRTASCL